MTASAAGLAVEGTRWRAVPDLLPADYPLLFLPKAPAEFAEILLKSMVYDGTRLRECFIEHFTEERHLEKLRALLIETSAE